MFDNKVTLVTGASRGIGKAIALEMGRHGARVIGTATSAIGAESISTYLQDENIRGTGFELNVRDQVSIQNCIDRINEDWGAIEILINNAGVTRDNLLMRMKLEEWEEVYETNLRSIFLLSKLCMRAMLKARFGRIINISSTVGATGNPGQANYAATKAGMIGFTKSLAREVANRGVTVNCVAPGFIGTDMTDTLSDAQREQITGNIPMGRLGDVDEVARATKFLASADASYITGHTLHVNGGLHME